MLTHKECEILNAHTKGTMMEALGMKFMPTDDDCVVVEMPIMPATSQHLGILHGGAYLALAETVAGAGSMHLTGFSAAVCGVEVSGNHLRMSATKGKVYGRGTLLAEGNTLHVWNVNVEDETGQILSTSRVVNRIMMQNPK